MASQETDAGLAVNEEQVENEDPFDSTDFNAANYVNDVFPNGALHSQSQSRVHSTFHSHDHNFSSLFR